MIGEFSKSGVIIGLLSSGVRLSTPFLLASIGEMFSQRSGVYNLGVEGIMNLGAFISFFIALKTSNPYFGIFVTILIGLVMGLVTAFINVTMKAEQGISGIGIYFFGYGLSGLLFRLTLGSIVTTSGFEPLSIPILSKLPFIGEVFFNQNWMVYLALLLVPISYIILFRTTFGLKVRAVGENPHAADTLGVSVAKIRYICIVIGVVLAALAGSFLTIGQIEATFVDNIAAGRGFIAIALVYFGRWRPSGILWGSFLFSFIDALQLRIQVLGTKIPYEYAVMTPYVITILVLSFLAGRAKGPSALGKPFEREST